MISRPEGRWREHVRLFLTGFAMGTADIVPGVSGGTIAFVLGVYEQLIASIKTSTGIVLRHLLRLQIGQAVRAAPWAFTLPLLLGILVAIFSLANLLSWLLDEHPIFVWAFFFGLVGASIRIVVRRSGSWNATGVAAFLLASLGAYFLVGMAPASTPDTPLAVFFSGAIAICAMILPGISGAFILILLGKYDQILEAAAQRDVLTLAVFFLGAAVGISIFSRVLSWLLARYHDLVLITLAGLMLGSLRKVWPWKEPIGTAVDDGGLEVPIQQANVLPNAFDLSTITALVLCIAGAALVFAISSADPRSPQPHQAERKQ